MDAREADGISSPEESSQGGSMLDLLDDAASLSASLASINASAPLVPSPLQPKANSRAAARLQRYAASMAQVTNVSSSPVLASCVMRLHVAYNATAWGEHVIAVGVGASGALVAEPHDAAEPAPAPPNATCERGIRLECRDDGHGRRTWVGAAAVAAPNLPGTSSSPLPDDSAIVRYRYVVVDDRGRWLRDEVPLGGRWRVVTGLPASGSVPLSIEAYDTWREGRGFENLFANNAKFRRVVIPCSADPPPPPPPRRDGAPFDADFSNGGPSVSVQFNVRAPIPLVSDESDAPAALALCISAPFEAVVTMTAMGADQTGVYRATCVFAREHVPLSYHFTVVRQVPGVPGVPGSELERERDDRYIRTEMLRGASARHPTADTAPGDEPPPRRTPTATGSGTLALASGAHVVCVDDGAFQRRAPPWRGAGIAVPVFSLRAAHCVGVGDFGALAKFAAFVAKCGGRVLQILPVNDTRVHGDFRDSYPYGVMSSVALHPLYLDVEALWSDAAGDGAADAGANSTTPPDVRSAIVAARDALEGLPSVDYPGTLAAKLDIAKLVFQHLFHERTRNLAAYRAFVEENAEWLRPYAAYNYLAFERFHTTDLAQWGDLERATEADVDDLCRPDAPHHHHIEFVLFTQYALHVQLLRATTACEKLRVALKGDLSIGVHPRSVDVWHESRYFRTFARTGAPPDYFDANGQNWGFPTYDWAAMAEDGFRWWRRRMRRLAAYFHAYRIDHVLGFFRIWELPYWTTSGRVGQLRPSVPYTREELERAGLWDIEKYTEPFITERAIFETIFGENAGYGGRLPPPPPDVLPPVVVVGGGVGGGGVQYVGSNQAEGLPATPATPPLKVQPLLAKWRKEQQKLLVERMEVVRNLIRTYFVPHPKDATRLSFRQELCTEELVDAFFAIPRDAADALAAFDASNARASSGSGGGGGALDPPSATAAAPAPSPPVGDAAATDLVSITQTRRAAEECCRLRLLFHRLHSHVLLVRDSDDPDNSFHPRFDISGDVARDAARAASATASSEEDVLAVLGSPLACLPDRPAPCGNPAFVYGVSNGQQHEMLRGMCHDSFYGGRNADTWRRTAMERLPNVVAAGSGMLCCTEDLGLVPDVVPGVMGDLGLLGLRIERMPCTHEEDFVDDALVDDTTLGRPGTLGTDFRIDAREFGAIPKYPYLSVCSPSCHDAAPFRLWLEEDVARRGRYEEHLLLLRRAGIASASPPRMHAQDPSPSLPDPEDALTVSELARDVMWNHLCAPSALAVFPLQDVLAIRVSYAGRPAAEEVINIPSNPEHYWRYRVQIPVEALLADTCLTDEVDRLVRDSGRDAGMDGAFA